MTNEELLEKLGKVLEAERDQTRKIIREEIEAEATETRREFRMKLFEVQTDLLNVRDKVKDVAIVTTQVKTAVEAVAAGQQDLRVEVKTIRSEMATKADMQDLDAKLVKRVNSHEKRIDDLEKETGLPNPHKN